MMSGFDEGDIKATRDLFAESTPSDRAAKALWRCMQCSKSSESADMLTMHSANTGHQSFYGTEADLHHHRRVVSQGQRGGAG